MGIGDRDLDFKMSLKILYNKDFLKDLKTRLGEKHKNGRTLSRRRNNGEHLPRSVGGQNGRSL